MKQGEDWKKHRKICNPGFSLANQKHVFESVQQYSNLMFNKWDNTLKNNGDICDVDAEMVNLTLSIIGTAGTK